MADIYAYDPQSRRWKCLTATESSRSSSIYFPLFTLGLLLVCGAAWAVYPKSKSAIAFKVEEKELGSRLPMPIETVDWSIREPVFGQIRLGAYAGEAANVAGIEWSSTWGLNVPGKYLLYRRSVRRAYGVDLEDMNYFSIGGKGWERRLGPLHRWILNAGQFGDVTIALEPDSKDGFSVFSKSAGMDELRRIFMDAQGAGITVWIRFGSEANLSGSPYSVYDDRVKAVGHFEKACWFKANMPDNVRMVFSPLINTAVHGWRNQKQTLRWMFQGDESTQDLVPPWDCIGGTLYRTNMSLKPTFNRYYALMNEMEPSLPFQLCELGGPYERKHELMDFLKLAASGQWERLKKVNLFARQINRRADPKGRFGFMHPEERLRACKEAKSTGTPHYVTSYLKPLLLRESKKF